MPHAPGGTGGSAPGARRAISGRGAALSVESVGTVVIGAGQAGLAVSHALRRLGSEHVILEQGQVAQAWRGRWDSFTLVTPNWTIRLPAGAYNGPDPDGFLPRDEIVAMLERYAAGAPVRSGVQVTAVDPEPAGGFTVSTGSGPIRAANVIVATGTFQSERPSPFGSHLPARVLQLHTSGYRNPGTLPPGAVLVVGSGQSGCQIAEELLEAGRTVHLSVGTAGRVPRRYRGRDIFHWLAGSGFLDRTVDKLPSPKAKFAGNPHATGRGGGHTINLHRFARNGMRLHGHVQGVRGERVRFAADLHANLAAADTFAADLTGGIDEYIRNAGVDAPPPDAANTDEYDGHDGFAIPEQAELDLAAEGISTVIWAGGYRFDYSLVHAPVLDPDGFPITRRGVTRVPGLYFLGMHFLYDGKSSILYGVGGDAEHVARHLAGGGADDGS